MVRPTEIQMKWNKKKYSKWPIQVPNTNWNSHFMSTTLSFNLTQLQAFLPFSRSIAAYHFIVSLQFDNIIEFKNFHFNKRVVIFHMAVAILNTHTQTISAVICMHFSSFPLDLIPHTFTIHDSFDFSDVNGSEDFQKLPPFSHLDI